jgi:hypothetical protein
LHKVTEFTRGNPTFNPGHCLEIESPKKVSLGVVDVDVLGFMVSNEPLDDESTPTNPTHNLMVR